MSREYTLGPVTRADNAEAKISELEKSVLRLASALLPVAVQAVRLEAMGVLDADGGDEWLSFPADVELSVGALKEARAALNPVGE